MTDNVQLDMSCHAVAAWSDCLLLNQPQRVTLSGSLGEMHLSYDSVGQMISRSVVSGAYAGVDTFSYDGYGRVHRQTSAEGVVYEVYLDTQGDMSGYSLQVGDTVYLSEGSNHASRRPGIRSFTGGETVSTTYWPGTGLLDTLQAGERVCKVSSYYDMTWAGEIVLGPPESTHQVVRKDGYDGQGRLTSRRYLRGEALLVGYAYTYDSSGQLWKRTHLHTGVVDIYEYTSGRRIHKINHRAVPKSRVCASGSPTVVGTSTASDCISPSRVGSWTVTDPEDSSVVYYGGEYERSYTYSGDYITDISTLGSGPASARHLSYDGQVGERSKA